MFRSLVFKFRLWAYRWRCALERMDQHHEGNGDDQARRAPRRKYGAASRVAADEPAPVASIPPPASPPPAPVGTKQQMLADAWRARRQ